MRILRIRQKLIRNQSVFFVLLTYASYVLQSKLLRSLTDNNNRLYIRILEKKIEVLSVTISHSKLQWCVVAASKFDKHCILFLFLVLFIFIYIVRS